MKVKKCKSLLHGWLYILLDSLKLFQTNKNINLMSVRFRALSVYLQLFCLILEFISIFFHTFTLISILYL